MPRFLETKRKQSDDENRNGNGNNQSHYRKRIDSARAKDEEEEEKEDLDEWANWAIDYEDTDSDSESGNDDVDGPGRIKQNHSAEAVLEASANNVPHDARLICPSNWRSITELASSAPSSLASISLPTIPIVQFSQDIDTLSIREWNKIHLSPSSTENFYHSVPESWIVSELLSVCRLFSCRLYEWKSGKNFWIQTLRVQCTHLSESMIEHATSNAFLYAACRREVARFLDKWDNNRISQGNGYTRICACLFSYISQHDEKLQEYESRFMNNDITNSTSPITLISFSAYLQPLLTQIRVLYRVVEALQRNDGPTLDIAHLGKMPKTSDLQTSTNHVSVHLTKLAQLFLEYSVLLDPIPSQILFHLFGHAYQPFLHSIEIWLRFGHQKLIHPDDSILHSTPTFPSLHLSALPFRPLTASPFASKNQLNSFPRVFLPQFLQPLSELLSEAGQNILFTEIIKQHYQTLLLSAPSANIRTLSLIQDFQAKLYELAPHLFTEYAPTSTNLKNASRLPDNNSWSRNMDLELNLPISDVFTSTFSTTNTKLNANNEQLFTTPSPCTLDYSSKLTRFLFSPRAGDALPVLSHTLKDDFLSLLSKYSPSLNTSPTADASDIHIETDTNIPFPSLIRLISYSQFSLIKESEITRNYLVSTLLTKCQFLAHIQALHGFYLLANAPLIQQMSDSLFNYMHTSSASLQNMSTFFSSALMAALTTSSPLPFFPSSPEMFNLVDHISLRIPQLPVSFRFSPTSMAFFELIKFQYTISSPLQILFPESILTKYNSLCTFAFSFKYANYLLLQMDISSWRLLPRSPLIQTFCIFRAELYHFIRSTINYISIAFHHSHWLTFQTWLDSQLQDGTFLLKNFAEKHEEYIDKVLSSVLLSPKMASAHATVKQMLDVVAETYTLYGTILDLTHRTLDDMPVYTQKLKSEEAFDKEDDYYDSDLRFHGIRNSNMLLLKKQRDMKRRKHSRQRSQLPAFDQVVMEREFLREQEELTKVAMHKLIEIRTEYRKHIRLLCVVIRKLLHTDIDKTLDEWLTRLTFTPFYLKQ